MQSISQARSGKDFFIVPQAIQELSKLFKGSGKLRKRESVDFNRQNRFVRFEKFFSHIVR
jgi:hypothetical protein